MDLLALYDSDSESQKECSEAVESNCLPTEDYFNLDCGSSDDDDNDNYNDNLNNVRAMALILSDKPYNPERPSSNQNSDENFKQNKNGMNFLTVECPIRPTFEKYGAVKADSCYNPEESSSICGTFKAFKCVRQADPDCNSKTGTVHISSNYDKSTVPNKKMKTDCDRTKHSIHSDNLSDSYFCNTQRKFSSLEDVLDSTEKKASFSECEQVKDNNQKSLPSSFPKKKIKTFNGHSAPVSCLRWCVPQYSHLLLSGSFDSHLKVWDIRSKKMVQDITIPSSRIKAAQWMPSGTGIICGGFNKKTHIFDITSGKELMTYNFSSYVYSIEIHPISQHLFVVGIKDKVLAFDTRNNFCEPVRKFESRCGQILDVKFLEDGNEFVCSTEIVSGDSADRTIMAWDFSSGAQLSNQIFHERYTCPFLQVDPNYKSFVAQTNGNYIAIFSTQRPYKMNKNTRYEGHKVLGFPVGCDFSANGKYLASGDAEGDFYIYWNYSAQLVKRYSVIPGVPTTQVKWHPHLHTTVATSSWNGEVQLWQ